MGSTPGAREERRKVEQQQAIADQVEAIGALLAATPDAKPQAARVLDRASRRADACGSLTSWLKAKQAGHL